MVIGGIALQAPALRKFGLFAAPGLLRFFVGQLAECVAILRWSGGRLGLAAFPQFAPSATVEPAARVVET